MKQSFAPFILLFLMPIIAFAQNDDTCPRIVRTALNLTRENCDETSANEACYGHVLLDTEARPGVEEFKFDEPGDIVDLLQIESMRLSAMDTQLGQWGVMLLEIEAEGLSSNPDTLSERVLSQTQMLLFGDVELIDANRFIRIQAIEDTSIYPLPDLTETALVTVKSGESLTANARTGDDKWLRVRYSDSNDGLGWVQADLFDTTVDIEELEVIAEDEIAEIPLDARARFGPMQAFTLSTGADDSPCDEAPNSGILIQTPEGVASVSLWMDEVVIQINATAFIQAQPDGNLRVDVLAGEIEVRSEGESRVAYAGTSIEVPLNADLQAIDVPSAPIPLNMDNVQSLPLELLDRPVSLPNPAQVGTPFAGSWSFQWGVDELTCPDGTPVPFVSDNTPTNISIRDDGITLGGINYRQDSVGIYSASYSDPNGNLHQDTLTISGFDSIQGEKVLDLVSPVCTLTVPFFLTLQSSFN